MVGVEYAQMKETRRKFLCDLFVLVGGTAIFGLFGGENRRVGPDSVFKIDFDEKRELSFNEAAQIALRLNRLSEQLPPYRQEISLAWLESLMARFMPVLVDVGVISQPVFPVLEVVHFSDRFVWTNVRARTENCGPVLEITDRLFDPTDPWSRQPGRAMAMIAHEIIHPQQGTGICRAAALGGETLIVESSANIASMEVMAACFFQDYPEAIFGLMSRLGESALASALILAAIERNGDGGKSLIADLKIDDDRAGQLIEDFETALASVNAGRGGHGRIDFSVAVKKLVLPLLVEAVRENKGQVSGLLLSPVGGYKLPKTENIVEESKDIAIPHLIGFLRNVEVVVGLGA